jgi:hypothetical protein
LYGSSSSFVALCCVLDATRASKSLPEEEAECLALPDLHWMLHVLAMSSLLHAVFSSAVFTHLSAAHLSVVSILPIADLILDGERVFFPQASIEYFAACPT